MKAPHHFYINVPQKKKKTRRGKGPFWEGKVIRHVGIRCEYERTYGKVLDVVEIGTIE